MKSKPLVIYTNENNGQSWWMYNGKIIKSNHGNAATLSATHYALRDNADPDIIEGIKFLVSAEGLLLEGSGDV